MACFCIGGDNCCIKRTNYCPNCGAIWYPGHNCGLIPPAPLPWTGHCCVCSGFCYHTNAPTYCGMHSQPAFVDPLPQPPFWWTTTTDNTSNEIHG